MPSELVGLGLYTIKEASILTGISPLNIRRWLYGYKSTSAKFLEPLWHPQLEEEEVEGIGFQDLLEIQFVEAFRKFGVSLQSIRLASQNASELYHSPYPFTCRNFRTDGHSIFAKLYEETGEEKLVDLGKRQYVMKHVITPSLYAGIEFSNNEAAKWYPVPKKKTIVLNPARSFGKPIIEQFGVPTAALFESYKVEEDKKLVSRIFEVPIKVVSDAIEYEKQLVA